jgi:hypothetical protein
MCFRPQVRRPTPTLFGPIERANLYHRTDHCDSLSPEDAQISSYRNVFFLEHRTIGSVQTNPAILSGMTLKVTN